MQQFLKSWFILPTLNLTTSPTAAARLALIAALCLPLPGAAQGLFTAAITVNEDVITHFEVQQRAQFMRLLRIPGDPEKLARQELINDRLKQSAVAQSGINLSEEDIAAGLSELAGRANLTLAEFTKVMGQNGVAPETLRDYTISGITWREYIAAHFLSRARPSEGEVDRAMGRSGSGGVQVLLSELIIPINEQNAPQVEALADEVSQLRSYDAFSSAATQYSAADSRGTGGRLPWMALTKLPPQLQAVVLALNPGEVTAPLPLQGAVALFQMRGIRETTGAAPHYIAIEYVSYLIPGGRSPAAQASAQQVISQVDTCDDFYGIAKDQDPAVLELHSLAPADIPRDVALELAKLDTDETSTTVTRNNGQTLMLLMMCGRTADLGEGADRQSVANALTQQRLAAFSDSFVEQLRADAEIVEK